MKVKGLKGIAKIEAEFKALNNDLKSEKYMRELGEFAAGIIQGNSGQRSGSVAEGGAERTPYKKLAPSTVAQRKRDEKLANENGFATSPTTSNITRTGPLRKSIGVKSVTKSTVTVGPKGTREKRGNEKRTPTNEQVGEYVTAAGRPFNNLSVQEQKQVANKIAKDLKTMIRSRLGKGKKK